MTRDSLWAVAAAITLIASRFTLTAIIARRLGTGGFGQFAYGQWLVDMAFLICSLGATGVVGRYLAECREDAGMMSAVVRRWYPYALGLPCLTGLAVVLGVWMSGLELSAVAMAMLALWAIANGLWAMQTAALTGLQRFDRIFLANAVAAVVMLGGASIMPMQGQDAARLFGLMALAAGLGMLVGFRETAQVARAVPALVDAARWRTIRKYAMNIWLTGLIWSLVWSRGEIPVVRAYLGDDGVARYAAALSLFGGAIQAVMLATAGIGQKLTRLWGQGLHEPALALARNVMDLQLLACGLSAVLLICFSQEWLHLAFGADYRAEAPILTILSLGLLAMALSCQNHMLQIATDARFNRNATLLGLGILLGSAGCLVSLFGLPGAAWARAGTMLVLTVVSVAVIERRWGRLAYSRRNLCAVSILVAASAALVFRWPDLALGVRACTAIFISFLLLIAVRDSAGNLQVIVILNRCRQGFASLHALPNKERR